MPTATAKRATGGKGAARPAQKPAKGKAPSKSGHTPEQSKVLEAYSENIKARQEDSTVPVDVELLAQVKQIKPDYNLDEHERNALNRAKLAAAPQARKASRNKAKVEPDASPAFPLPDGSTRVATRVAYHAVDGTPEGTLKFLGVYEFPTHTEAIAKARKEHKLDDSAVIVTLNARHAVRSKPRDREPIPAAAGKGAPETSAA